MRSGRLALSPAEARKSSSTPSTWPLPQRAAPLDCPLKPGPNREAQPRARPSRSRPGPRTPLETGFPVEEPSYLLSGTVFDSLLMENVCSHLLQTLF